MTATIEHGVVVRFTGYKDFGFIRSDSGDKKDIYFRGNAAHKGLRVGTRVSFIRMTNGIDTAAVQIKILDEPTPVIPQQDFKAPASYDECIKLFGSAYQR